VQSPAPLDHEGFGAQGVAASAMGGSKTAGEQFGVDPAAEGRPQRSHVLENQMGGCHVVEGFGTLL
jgi:hypothetical protein